MILTRHNLWMEFLDGLAFGATAKPAAGSFYAFLCADGALDKASTMAQLAALELPAANGIARLAVPLGVAQMVGDGSTRAFGSLVWTPTATISYRYIVVIANGAVTQGSTAGVPVLIGTQPSPRTVIANTPETFNLSNRIA